MTPEEHLRILGPAVLAENRRRVAAAPPPPPGTLASIRTVLAPAMARVLAREAAEAARQQSAA